MKTISSIARTIIRDIETRKEKSYKQAFPHAAPYLQAMLSLETMDDYYGLDSAQSVVSYALANLSSWRGPVSVTCKAELRQMLKGAK